MIGITLCSSTFGHTTQNTSSPSTSRMVKKRMHRFRRALNEHSLCPPLSYMYAPGPFSTIQIVVTAKWNARNEVHVETRDYWNWDSDLGWLQLADSSGHQFLVVTKLYRDWWHEACDTIQRVCSHVVGGNTMINEFHVVSACISWVHCTV